MKCVTLLIALLIILFLILLFIINSDKDYFENDLELKSPLGCDDCNTSSKDFYKPLGCWKNEEKETFVNDEAKSKPVKQYNDNDCLLITQYPDIPLTSRKDRMLKTGRRPKNELDVIDVQTPCNQQNNFNTAENYYNKFFRYPIIPLPSENDRWIPYDYVETNYLANPNIDYSISKGKRPDDSIPYPHNYVFAR